MLFVGDERREIVHQLVRAFDAVGAGERSQLVSLEAPSGWGKTRIVQELYRELAARQPEPRYWPEALGSTDSAASLLDLRKTIHPSVVVPERGAALQFMWWGIACHRRADGRAAQVLADDITQLETHAEAIVRAAEARDRRNEAARSIAIGVLGTLNPVGGLVAALGDAGQKTASAIRAQRARAALEAPGRELAADRVERVDVQERAHALLKAVAAGAITTVMVLDEAHNADPSLIALLDQVLRASDLRVLVVACSWPEPLWAGDEDSFGAWLEDAPTVTRLRLEPLAVDDLAAMVTDTAPRVDRHLALTLARHADGNPFVLAGTLDHRRVRSRIYDGRIDLDAADVADLPSTAREMLKARWHSLDEALRDALAIAALQGRTFLDELVGDASAALREDGVTDRLPDAAGPLAWVERLDALYVFREQWAYDLAEAEVRELFGERELRAAFAAMAVRIDDWLEDGLADLPGRARRHLLALRVRLAERDDRLRPGGFIVAEALGNALAHAGATLDSLAAYESAERLADSPAQRLRAVGPLALTLRRLERVPEAIERLEAATAELDPMDSEEAALADKLLAELYLQQGDHGRARAHAERAATFVGDPWIRLGLADVLWHTGEGREAIAERRTVLETLQAEHREPFLIGDAASDLANWLLETGDSSGALAVAEIGRAAFAEAYGPESREVLRTRLWAALARGDLGGPEEAIAELRSIVDTARNALGDEHAETLLARRYLLGVLVQTGEPGARAELVRLRETHLRLFGADAPEARAIDQFLEAFGATSLTAEQAIALLRLDEPTRVQRELQAGPDAPLETRELLAAAHWYADDRGSSIHVLRELAAAAAGTTRERRYTRLLDQAVAAPPEGSLRPAAAEPDEELRKALRALASAPRFSPLLELTLMRWLRIGLDAAPVDGEHLALGTIMAINVAGHRLAAGEPTFPAAAPAAPVTMALKPALRELVESDPFHILMFRLAGESQALVAGGSSGENLVRAVTRLALIVLASGASQRMIPRELQAHIFGSFPPT